MFSSRCVRERMIDEDQRQPGGVVADIRPGRDRGQTLGGPRLRRRAWRRGGDARLIRPDAAEIHRQTFHVQVQLHARGQKLSQMSYILSLGTVQLVQSTQVLTRQGGRGRLPRGAGLLQLSGSTGATITSRALSTCL